MTVADVLTALALPPETQVDRRIPKKLLIENGASTASDKRQINDGIEELLWVAALKPANIGVPEYRDDVRHIAEISVLAAKLRANGKITRLAGLIHRAIPYPVFLILMQAGVVTLSLAEKRFAQNEVGKVIVDGAFFECTLEPSAYLPCLALSAQPRSNLNALYRGWLVTLESLQAAAITGRYLASGSEAVAEVRRQALSDHARLAAEIAGLRNKAGKETQISRRVEFNLEIKRLENALRLARAKLALDGTPAEESL